MRSDDCLSSFSDNCKGTNSNKPDLQYWTCLKLHKLKCLSAFRYYCESKGTHCLNWKYWCLRATCAGRLHELGPRKIQSKNTYWIVHTHRSNQQCPWIILRWPFYQWRATYSSSKKCRLKSAWTFLASTLQLVPYQTYHSQILWSYQQLRQSIGWIKPSRCFSKELRGGRHKVGALRYSYNGSVWRIGNRVGLSSSGLIRPYTSRAMIVQLNEALSNNDEINCFPLISPHFMHPMPSPPFPSSSAAIWPPALSFSIIEQGHVPFPLFQCKKTSSSWSGSSYNPNLSIYCTNFPTLRHGH